MDNMTFKEYSLQNDVFLSGKPDEVKNIAKLGVEATRAYIAEEVTLNATNDKTLSSILKSFGKNESPREDYEKAFLFATMKYASRDPDFDEKDLPKLKDPNFTSKTDFRERYYDIVNTVLTTVIPTVTSVFVNSISEVHNVGWGDTSRFIIESNEIFQVTRHAEGIRMGANQRVYNTEVTVNPIPYNITFDTNWYQIASGIVNFGRNFYRASLAFAQYFTAAAYDELINLNSRVPAGYTAAAWSDDNARIIGNAVSAANGGIPVSMVGTSVAVSKILPDNDYLKFGLGQEWTARGYIGMYAGMPVIEIPQLILPNRVNDFSGASDFLLRDDLIFFIPMFGRRPVKIVFEGGLFEAYRNAVQTPDKVERVSLTYRVGIKGVFDHIYGVLTLS